jgi:uncharacterized membrane protein YfcA
MDPNSGNSLAKVLLLVALGGFTLYYLVIFVRAIAKKRHEAAGESNAPTPIGLGTGFITNFFDTLGIGSYAPTTSIFRFLKMVPDEWIPGTLTIGHTLPTIAEAYIFTRIVPVDPTTLVAMIGASILGAWLGAGVVSKWPRRMVQLGMGFCLLAAAGLMAAYAIRGQPVGGQAIGVTGVLLGVAIAGNFVLGALMTIGIGLYAPCMILISLVGMNVKAAFPIMMCSCAFLMPVASARFARTGAFHLKTALGLAIGGIPAVLIAAFIVKSLPLNAVQWLVVVVVLYTSWSLLRAAQRERASVSAPATETVA